MRLNPAGISFLMAGIASEVVSIFAALRQIANGQVNPYLANFSMGIGFGITVVAAIWTMQRDKRGVERDRLAVESKLLEEQKLKEEKDRERHEENQRAIKSNGDELKDMKKLVQGGLGYPGLMAAAERSEWRRHQFLNIMTPVLNDLRDMSNAICELAEKQDVRFRAEIADTFSDAAKRLQEDPPFPHRRLSDL